MNNDNFKSESYVIQEAENIIKNYIEKRRISNYNKYYKTREKNLKKIFYFIFAVTIVYIIIFLFKK